MDIVENVEKIREYRERARQLVEQMTYFPRPSGLRQPSTRNCWNR